jgi:hypothetical protein
MKRLDLSELTVQELVARFAEIGVDQDKAIVNDGSAKFNRLFFQMKTVEDELKARDGDQRRALLPLFRHDNMQVRLMAAKSTLAVAPEAARKMLQTIADSRWPNQGGDAGMCLWALDEGIFKPS